MSGQSGGHRLRLSMLNEQLTCKLCGGYFIDATTIIECLHSFCRSCIVKYLENNKYCPICEVQVHKSKPLLNIRPDHTLQDIVYKLVPACYQNEMRCRRDFYAKNPEALRSTTSPEARGEPVESHIYSPDESLSLSLEYYNPIDQPILVDSGHDDAKESGAAKKLDKDDKDQQLQQKPLPKRYLRCPAAVTVFHLQKLIRAKYGLSEAHRVDVMYKEETLCDTYTLMDVMYIYHWRRKVPLHLSYRIFESSPKRLKLAEDNENFKQSLTNAGIRMPVDHRAGTQAQQQQQQQQLQQSGPGGKREWKEVQLKISETGVMSVTDITSPDSKKNSKTEKKSAATSGGGSSTSAGATAEQKRLEDSAGPETVNKNEKSLNEARKDAKTTDAGTKTKQSKMAATRSSVIDDKVGASTKKTRTESASNSSKLNAAENQSSDSASSADRSTTRETRSRSDLRSAANSQDSTNQANISGEGRTHQRVETRRGKASSADASGGPGPSEKTTKTSLERVSGESVSHTDDEQKDTRTRSSTSLSTNNNLVNSTNNSSKDATTSSEDSSTSAASSNKATKAQDAKNSQTFAGSKIDALSAKLQFQPKIGEVNNTYSKKAPKEKRTMLEKVLKKSSTQASSDSTASTTSSTSVSSSGGTSAASESTVTPVKTVGKNLGESLKTRSNTVAVSSANKSMRIESSTSVASSTSQIMNCLGGATTITSSVSSINVPVSSAPSSSVSISVTTLSKSSDNSQVNVGNRKISTTNNSEGSAGTISSGGGIIENRQIPSQSSLSSTSQNFAKNNYPRRDNQNLPIPCSESLASIGLNVSTTMQTSVASSTFPYTVQDLVNSGLLKNSPGATKVSGLTIQKTGNFGGHSNNSSSPLSQVCPNVSFNLHTPSMSIYSIPTTTPSSLSSSSSTMTTTTSTTTMSATIAAKSPGGGANSGDSHKEFFDSLTKITNPLKSSNKGSIGEQQHQQNPSKTIMTSPTSKSSPSPGGTGNFVHQEFLDSLSKISNPSKTSNKAIDQQHSGSKTTMTISTSKSSPAGAAGNIVPTHTFLESLAKISNPSKSSNKASEQQVGSKSSVTTTTATTPTTKNSPASSTGNFVQTHKELLESLAKISNPSKFSNKTSIMEQQQTQTGSKVTMSTTNKNSPSPSGGIGNIMQTNQEFLDSLSKISNPPKTSNKSSSADQQQQQQQQQVGLPKSNSLEITSVYTSTVPPCPDGIPISLMKPTVRKHEVLAKGTNLNEICAKIGENTKEKNKAESAAARARPEIPDLLKISKKPMQTSMSDSVTAKHIPNIPNVPIYTPSNTLAGSDPKISYASKDNSKLTSASSLDSIMQSGSLQVMKTIGGGLGSGGGATGGKKSMSMGYKTLRDPPKSWNPTLTKNNYVALKNQAKESLLSQQQQQQSVQSMMNQDSIGSKGISIRPAKRHSRNVPRFLGNPASGVKPLYGSAELKPGEIKDHGGGVGTVTTGTTAKNSSSGMTKIDPKTLSPIVSTSTNSPIVSPPPYSPGARGTCYQSTPFSREICVNRSTGSAGGGGSGGGSGASGGSGSPISTRSSPVNILSTNPFIPSPTPNTNPRMIYPHFPPPFPDASRFPNALIRSPIGIPPPSAFHNSLPPSINKIYQRTSYMPQTTGVYGQQQMSQPPAVQRIPASSAGGGGGHVSPSLSPKSPKKSSSPGASFALPKTEATNVGSGNSHAEAKNVILLGNKASHDANAFNLTKSASPSPSLQTQQNSSDFAKTPVSTGEKVDKTVSPKSNTTSTSQTKRDIASFLKGKQDPEKQRRTSGDGDKDHSREEAEEREGSKKKNIERASSDASAKNQPESEKPPDDKKDITDANSATKDAAEKTLTKINGDVNADNKTQTPNKQQEQPSARNEIVKEAKVHESGKTNFPQDSKDSEHKTIQQTQQQQQQGNNSPGAEKNESTKDTNETKSCDDHQQISKSGDQIQGKNSKTTNAESQRSKAES